ncbi:MAG: hypothetical protein V1691_04005 [Chloroflexota bacterium]
MQTRKRVALAFLSLLLLLGIAGCQTADLAETSTTPSHNAELSATMVPDIDLDLYVYINQGSPASIPKDITGTPFDIVAESLSLWGIADDDGFTLGGGLTTDSENHAAMIADLVPSQEGIWVAPLGSTIYFVEESGSAAEKLEDAISHKAFKTYDDKKALAEVALLPDGGTAVRAATAIATPSDALVHLLANSVSTEDSQLIETMFKWAHIQVVTAGLYSSQPIDVIQTARNVDNGSIWNSELGVVASVKSGLPGFIVSPIVVNFLEKSGYAKTDINGLSVYQGSLDTGGGQAVPVFIRVDGNRIFAAVSGDEAYARTLITGTK